MSKFANIQFKNFTSEVQAKVQLITFTENEICFCYCPQLDTTGYGHNEQEAFDSFNIVIKEFFNYTTNKKTLGKILENLGWKIKKGSTKKPTNMISPTWQNLLEKNPTLEDITKKEFKVSNHSVGIPA